MTPLTQHFHEAVIALAGHEPMKNRLISAYVDHLGSLGEEDLPRALRTRYADLRRRLHAVAPLNGEGPVRASVRKMSGPEAADCASLIVQLYGDLARRDGRNGNLSAGPLQLVDSAEEEPLPEFLLKS